jgi:NADPH2:quinone reductase
MRHARIVVSRYGGPDALQLLGEERPEPTVSEVRVKVLAIALFVRPIALRMGRYQMVRRQRQ